MQRYLKLIHFCIVKFGTELKGRNITERANELISDMQHSPYIKFHCYTDDAEGLNDVFNVYKLSAEDRENTFIGT